MEISIKKIIKYIFLSLLILSITFPTFANYGTGEAFITKDEFDKTLSDFNNRLSSFEASINSKIDSQVSSYLDRNGIWSKNAQIFPTETIDWTKRSATFNKNFHHRTNWSNSYTAAFYMGGIILCHCKKSGLMFLVCHDSVPYDTSADHMGLSRGDIGLSFSAHAGVWTVDNVTHCKVRLLEMKDSMKDVEIGSLFVKTTDDENGAVDDFDSTRVYYLHQEIDHIVAECQWGNNFTGTLSGSDLNGRWAKTSYVGNAQYQLIGFVKKEKTYAIGMYGIFSAWSPNGQNFSITIDPLGSGNVGTINANSIGCRPALTIESCDVY